MSFSSKLLYWFEQYGRSLPWRGIDDPYKIWLSEIILQQTRIAQGMQYYYHFVEHYPTVQHLAKSSEEQILKSWQGLGYYSRARNMHKAAQQIVSQFGGHFPNRYEDILSLKGVGRYTAAAIASFAFRLPYPVIDGNVYRFVARHFDIPTPIATPAAFSEFENLLRPLLDPLRPDLFNQAVMDFGSTYCTPLHPDCPHCVFADSCLAFARGKVDLLPVKQIPTPVINRYFYYFDIQWNSFDNQDSFCLVHQRSQRDIWKGLYEFPLFETEQPLSDGELNQLLADYLNPCLEMPYNGDFARFNFVHRLTHRTIYAAFLSLSIPSPLSTPPLEQVISRSSLSFLPISRLIDRYLLSL